MKFPEWKLSKFPLKMALPLAAWMSIRVVTVVILVTMM